MAQVRTSRSRRRVGGIPNDVVRMSTAPRLPDEVDGEITVSNPTPSPVREPQSLEAAAIEAATRMVVAASLGHEGLVLRPALVGDEAYELRFSDGRSIPAWDGLLLDVAARQSVGGCRPDFAGCVPGECRQCLAEFAVNQSHVTSARSVLEDICESAARTVEQFEPAIEMVARELLLGREVHQEFVTRVTGL